jgi:hypothetical protein
MRSRKLTYLIAGIVVALISVAVACMRGPSLSPAEGQKTFGTAEEASDALIAAAGRGDTNGLLEIFGSDGKDLVSTADPVQDKNKIAAFAAKATEKRAINFDPKDSSKATLVVGNDAWPFPVPLVKTSGKWWFNTEAGYDEVMLRRIGSNELDAIQICRGFVDAEQEYAMLAREYTGVTQYAQKVISTPGKHDGLYWQKADGSPGGPISDAVAKAIEEGYSATQGAGYHGYYFKVLKGQGPAAPLGELDYMINGIMIGGFALMAVPAEYQVTGVKSFMVSYDGVVYEKDLGSDTLNVFKKTERYNPDETWHKTDDQWPET